MDMLIDEMSSLDSDSGSAPLPEEQHDAAGHDQGEVLSDLNSISSATTRSSSSSVYPSTPESPKAAPKSWYPRQSGERRNRFLGKSAQWRDWTANDRQIATGLDAVRARDLGIHLYNAFALTQRLGKEELSWKPHRSWTSWPMPADLVPRPGETTKNTVAFSWLPRPNSRQELEEILIAITTKTARDWFIARQVPRLRITHAGSRRSDGQMKTEEREVFDATENTKPVRAAVYIRDGRQVSREEFRDGRIAVPTANQEHSDRVLRPIVRNIETSLDKVLQGLHNSRQACMPQKKSSRTQGWNASKRLARDGQISETLASSISKTAKALDFGNRYLDFSCTETSELRSQICPKADESKSEGRSVENTSDLTSSDTESDLSNASDAFDDDQSQDPTKPSVGRSGIHTEQKALGWSSKHVPKRVRIGLRDWSDVLGMAGIAGAFPTQVIERARHRCEALFQEDMGMIVMKQNLKVEKRTVSEDEPQVNREATAASRTRKRPREPPEPGE